MAKYDIHEYASTQLLAGPEIVRYMTDRHGDAQLGRLFLAYLAEHNAPATDVETLSLNELGAKVRMHLMAAISGLNMSITLDTYRPLSD